MGLIVHAVSDMLPRMTPPDSRPPMEWMDHLYRAGQWERLESTAADYLAGHPDDRLGHLYRGWALMKLGRAKEMRPHVEFLLHEDPEDVEHLRLAALWHSDEGRCGKAAEHVAAALKLAPEDASLWWIASVAATRRHRLDEARKFIDRARQLDPDDADIAHVHILLHTAEQTGTRAAWNAVREHEKALALDPENDGLLASMGDVYLNELEMPERAEALYRQALALDPREPSHRKRLWQAMQKRNLLFRTLSLPISGLSLVGNFFRGLRINPLAFLWVVVGIKFVAIFLAWLVASMVVFGPPALMAEWLVMSDIDRASRAADKVGSWWLRFHHLPLSVRLGLCLLLMAGFWAALFAMLGISQSWGFAFIAGFFAVNLAVMAIRVSLRKSEARDVIRRSTPPPLPKPTAAWQGGDGGKGRSSPPPLPGADERRQRL